ncbi:MAG TPA: hypothetical protein DDZ51_24190 [Planctomycetaceae bacterium]|nr:hypothetical protein [Planctomycetaceae bacterium]
MTLAEIVVRAESFATAQWDHTSLLATLLYNTHRGPKSKAATQEDFHPYRKRRPKKMTVEHLHSLKSLFKPAEGSQ